MDIENKSRQMICLSAVRLLVFAFHVHGPDKETREGTDKAQDIKLTHVSFTTNA